ncbi:hypothetical protein DAEQUDRAFT_599239 [Daedalea quercina L-15889]|uniref:Uncharacterized protein n=1 Tax=Daedalea quercina L-15889 TaxID=1314783 RepID=A0A165LPV1_9APHY|nr:hypothetical protein DAEQUDRAFT_599239 [Daedalea quercina L-15889]
MCPEDAFLCTCTPSLYYCSVCAQDTPLCPLREELGSRDSSGRSVVVGTAGRAAWSLTLPVSLGSLRRDVSEKNCQGDKLMPVKPPTVRWCHLDAAIQSFKILRVYPARFGSVIQWTTYTPITGSGLYVTASRSGIHPTPQIFCVRAAPEL